MYAGAVLRIRCALAPLMVVVIASVACASQAAAAFLPISVAREVTNEYARDFYNESSEATGYRVGGCRRNSGSKVICQAIVHMRTRGLVGEAGDCFYPIAVRRSGGHVKSRWTGVTSASGGSVACY